MPAIDLSILNQRQTPAFYADTLANRPAAGFVGRIFVSTDTFAFYRDNGTTWDLIGGPGTGTITGSGANGQVSYWNGASTITGSNDLFFDAVNGHLGIGTVTPGTALDVKHDQSTVVQLEQVTATNDIRIAFINNGVGLWRLGAFYNAGANDFGLFDIAAAAQPVTVKRTTGQVLIGTSTVGSGKLVVASSTGDNGVQIVGAAAPSLRIDNAESGPTKRVGLGISTAANNFIQGSADRDFCIFNGSTTASPILFGIYDTTNVAEAARISSARNFLIGTTTDNGNKLQVNGSAFFNSNLIVQAPASTLFMSLRGRSSDDFGFIGFYNNTGLTRYGYIQSGSTNGGQLNITMDGGGQIIGDSRGLLFQPSNGKVGIGTSVPTTKLQISETTAGSASVATFLVNESVSLNTEVRLAFAANANNDITTNRYSYISALNTSGSNGQALTFATNATGSAPVEAMRISSSQNILIGTITDAGQKLQVAGTGSFVLPTGSNDQIITIARSGGAYAWSIGIDSTLSNFNFYNNGGAVVSNINNATGVYTPVSNKNLKKNFEKSNLGLDAILKLKPTLYNMISQSDHEAKELGFIAQEVKEVIEQAFVENGEFIGLNYQPIVATLVKAIQELNTKIENLKN
jgi:hypothetical protein